MLKLKHQQFLHLEACDLKTWLQPFTQQDGHKHIPIHIQLDTDFAQAELHLGSDWSVVPFDELLSLLRDAVGADCLKIDYQMKSKAISAQQDSRENRFVKNGAAKKPANASQHNGLNDSNPPHGMLSDVEHHAHQANADQAFDDDRINAMQSALDAYHADLPPYS